MTATHRPQILLLAITLLVTFLTYACKTTPQVKEDFTSPLIPDELWAQAVTENAGLDSLYVPNAIGILVNGSFYEGLSAIKAHLSTLYPEGIDTIYNLAREIAGRDSSYTYELSAYSSQGEHYRQLCIWNQQETTPKRELEFLAKANLSQRPDSTVLDTFRQLWIERCNAHDAYTLVAKSYTPNALYYNHKPLVIGTEAIATEYSYMNRAQYSLLLTPLVVEMVNPDLAFEIGQCSGSYGSKYVLVWQRNEKGIWQVLFDSNI